MDQSKADELAQIQRKLLILNIIDAPGAILVGLGLYGLFGANGEAFIDLLNNQKLAYAAIIVGGAIMLWAVVKMFPLLKRKAELTNEGPND